jgi:nitrate reductase alpha subunit
MDRVSQVEMRVGDGDTAKSYKAMRGHGGFVRSTWEAAQG